MKKLIPLFGICSLLVACASNGQTQPKTPSTTNTTAAPAPADANAPSDDKPIPPLNLQSPTDNPPSASMKNTTSQSAGDAPMSRGLANSTTGSAVGQGNSDTDRKMSSRIRKSLDANSSLSFGAKNVTIETSNGRVTLRGAVKSEREKAMVESAASQVAGPSQVDDQLSVAK